MVVPRYSSLWHSASCRLWVRLRASPSLRDRDEQYPRCYPLPSYSKQCRILVKSKKKQPFFPTQWSKRAAFSRQRFLRFSNNRLICTQNKIDSTELYEQSPKVSRINTPPHRSVSYRYTSLFRSDEQCYIGRWLGLSYHRVSCPYLPQ